MSISFKCCLMLCYSSSNYNILYLLQSCLVPILLSFPLLIVLLLIVNLMIFSRISLRFNKRVPNFQFAYPAISLLQILLCQGGRPFYTLVAVIFDNVYQLRFRTINSTLAIKSDIDFNALPVVVLNHSSSFPSRLLTTSFVTSTLSKSNISKRLFLNIACCSVLRLYCDDRKLPYHVVIKPSRFKSIIYGGI